MGIHHSFGDCGHLVGLAARNGLRDLAEGGRIGMWSLKIMKVLPSRKYLKCLTAEWMKGSSLSNEA